MSRRPSVRHMREDRSYRSKGGWGNGSALRALSPLTTVNRRNPDSGRFDQHVRAAVKYIVNYRRQRQAIRRGYIFRLVRRLGVEVIGVQCPAGMYLVSTSDQVLGRMTFERRGYEEEKLAAVVEMLGLQGGVFVDVGANVGVTTIQAVRRFGFDRAVAVEPSPDNLRLLRAAVALNDLAERVEVHPVGASNANGHLQLELSALNSGDHRIRMTAGDGAFSEGDRDVIDIPVVRLDDLDLDPTQVALLWIDVQGHDGHVLAGASRFTKCRVPIVVEYWPYGLRRADGLDLFHKTVANNYETIVDLTTGLSFGVDGLSRLAEEYRGIRHTDLLLR